MSGRIHRQVVATSGIGERVDPIRSIDAQHDCQLSTKQRIRHEMNENAHGRVEKEEEQRQLGHIGRHFRVAQNADNDERQTHAHEREIERYCGHGEFHVSARTFFGERKRAVSSFDGPLRVSNQLDRHHGRHEHDTKWQQASVGDVQDIECGGEREERCVAIRDRECVDLNGYRCQKNGYFNVEQEIVENETEYDGVLSVAFFEPVGATLHAEYLVDREGDQDPAGNGCKARVEIVRELAP